MSKIGRYIQSRMFQAQGELKSLLDEATLLVEALILQHMGSNSDRFKALDIRKASLDSLNSVLLTIKSLLKNKLHFLYEFIDNIREESLEKIKMNIDFSKIILHVLDLNLISDNNDISLYFAPYVDEWELLTVGVQAIIINHTIKGINTEIRKAQISEKITKQFA